MMETVAGPLATHSSLKHSTHMPATNPVIELDVHKIPSFSSIKALEAVRSVVRHDKEVHMVI